MANTGPILWIGSFKYKFLLIFDNLSFRGSGGQPMLLFLILIDENQMFIFLGHNEALLFWESLKIQSQNQI